MTAVQRMRVAVVGGGVGGLAAAHRLIELASDADRPVDVTLFEAGPRLGGVIETLRIGDYLVETGADSFITNKPAAVELCRRLGIADRLISTNEQHRGSLVLRKGRPLRVPEGFMLLSPARVRPVLASGIFSPWGKLRMGLEYVLPRGRHITDVEADESLASFVRRRFGREALDRLVQPLVGGIYTSDPDKLSLKATLPRFLEMERRHRSLIRASRIQAAENDASRSGANSPQGGGARYGLFATFANGLKELIDALAARVGESATIRLNSPVERVESIHEQCEPRPSGSAGAPLRSRLAFVLSLNDHESTTSHKFDAVILATPAHRTAEIVADFDPELARSLNEIEHASTAVVCTGHEIADVQHPLDAFGLVVPAIERRRVLAVSFSSRKFPGRAPEGHVLFRTFVGGAMQPELLAQTDEELIEMVKHELHDFLGVSGTADFAHVARYNNAMPQYHVGHLNRVAAIAQRVANHPGVELAGNAYRGVGIPDCIASGERAAEQIGRLK